MRKPYIQTSERAFYAMHLLKTQNTLTTFSFREKVILETPKSIKIQHPCLFIISNVSHKILNLLRTICVLSNLKHGASKTHLHFGETHNKFYENLQTKQISLCFFNCCVSQRDNKNQVFTRH